MASLEIEPASLTRDSPWSYVCHSCGRCCHGRVIVVNPYELVRLARYRGVSTTALIAESTQGGTLLRRDDDEACVFLTAQGCSVHPARPLVCRTYPLGSIDSDPPVYWEAEASEGSEGVYGTAGTVAGFLEGQDITEALEGRRLYEALYQEALANPGCDEGLDEVDFIDIDGSAQRGGHEPIADPFQAARAHVARLRLRLGR